MNFNFGFEFWIQVAIFVVMIPISYGCGMLAAWETKLKPAYVEDGKRFRKYRDARAHPIDMVLYCPVCFTQHIDKPSPCSLGMGCELVGVCYASAMAAPCRCDRWTNPPHRSHLCDACGNIWRPADVATNGVAEIRTYGEKDTFYPAHDLYEKGDADIPGVILDRNGDVTLGLCKRCGRAEVELDEMCMIAENKHG